MQRLHVGRQILFLDFRWKSIPRFEFFSVVFREKLCQKMISVPHSESWWCTLMRVVLACG